MMLRVITFLFIAAWATSSAVAEVKIEIQPDGFNAGKADIHAVCKSAASHLLKHMKDLPPMTVRVSHGKDSPISLYKPAEDGAIRVKLTSRQRFWAQYAYQFAHEMCHVLCGLEDDYRGNLWFEETLCEMASLYCMRQMATQWRTTPPYASWKAFAPHLRSYTDDVAKRRKEFLEILQTGTRSYYARHARYLTKQPVDREKNGAFALALLPLFEAQPQHWNAIRYLNSTPSPQGETFQQYLTKWHNAAPQKHREFIIKVAAMFGVEVAAEQVNQAD